MSSTTKYILVTGTNGGLGLGICMRLIDDFLRTQPQSSSLTLIFTTRSTKKGVDTRNTLQEHLSKNKSPSATSRIRLQPENVELTNLLSVRALAQKLVDSTIPKLDAIILNAGMASWSGLNWPMAYWTMLLDLRTSTTWPTFKLGIAGLLAPTQFPSEAQYTTEPPLGLVFCSNVFGHYMLVHWLMSLIQACPAEDAGRIIWVSSIEPRAKHFHEDDLQGLETTESYEHSKRLTDILALNYDQSSSSHAVSQFTQSHLTTTQTRPVRSSPTMHATHPGICTTSIMTLSWIMGQLYVVGILLARLVGSPWATVYTYTGAMVMSWITLVPPEDLKRQEAQYSARKGGRVKWGTAVSRLGEPSSRPTEIDNWGLNGSADSITEYWWGGKLGRAPGAQDAKKEDVEEFKALGSRVWSKMEELRVQWEARIEEHDQEKKSRMYELTSEEVGI